MCLDTLGRPVLSSMGAEYCHTEGGNQLMMITENHEIRRDMTCLDADGTNKSVVVYPCHMQKGNQQFVYHEEVGSVPIS